MESELKEVGSIRIRNLSLIKDKLDAFVKGDTIHSKEDKYTEEFNKNVISFLKSKS